MSKKDCRNDCATPLRFPRPPGTNFTVGTGADCFCCDAGTRISADNRPALAHFNYRIGTYASIREYLLHEINHAANLQRWTHREADDPAIALLESAAILGDILAFYQETYANEAFLRTAKWRESIADLVRLLGYRLSPAVGGKATFAFEIKKDEAVTIPAGFPVKAPLEEVENPAEFETVEEITAYPWLSRFNLFKPLEAPDITPATIEFYITSPNQWLSPVEIKVGDRLMIGEPDAGGASQPKKLINAEIAIVDSIREMHGARIFKIKGNLKRGAGVAQLAAYKLGRAFHHFGYNSPPTVTETENPITDKSEVTIKTVPVSRKVNQTFSDDLVAPDLISTNFPLDAEVQDLPNNVSVIIQANFRSPASSGKKSAFTDTSIQAVASQLQALEADLEYYQADLEFFQPTASEFSVHSELFIMPELHYAETAPSVSFTNLQNLRDVYPTELVLVRSVAKIKNAALAWGAMSATVSMLSLSESLETSVGATTEMNIRDAIFHEVVSPLLIIREADRETNALTGSHLNFYGTAAEVENLKDRRLMLEKTNGEVEILTVVSVPAVFNADTLNFPQLHQITLSDEVDYADFPNENPSITVYGNLADAEEGKTQPETALGSGDNTKIFQTFKLPKSPLTYHLQTANTPPETPELEIYVGGRLWRQVETLFGHEAGEQIYIVREDEENNSWVQFGDGKTGAKLPTGIKNVTAIQRTGTGAFGALKADTKAQAGAKIKNLDKIQMPLAATGGAERESAENARNAAPGKIQSLGRLVSIGDFEAETAAIPGVALASAALKLSDYFPAIVITVLMETGRSGEITAVQETLNGYNAGRGANRFPVKVAAGERRDVRVSVQYALDSTFRADLVEPEIRRALGVNFGKASNEEDQTGLFSLRQRRFGKREYASSIEGAVQSVAGVLWARVTAFSALSDTGEALQPVVSCDDKYILSLADENLFLTQAAI